MKAFTVLKITSGAALALGLAACSGGGSTGPSYDDVQIDAANNFVSDLNNEGGDHYVILKAIAGNDTGAGVFEDMTTGTKFVVDNVHDYVSGGSNWLSRDENSNDVDQVYSQSNGNYGSYDWTDDNGNALIYSKSGAATVDFRAQQDQAKLAAIAKAASSIRPHVNDMATALKVGKLAVQVQAAGGFQNTANVDAAVKQLTGTTVSSIVQEVAKNGPNSPALTAMAAQANKNGFGRSPEEAKQMVMGLASGGFRLDALK